MTRPDHEEIDRADDANPVRKDLPAVEDGKVGLRGAGRDPDARHRRPGGREDARRHREGHRRTASQ